MKRLYPILLLLAMFAWACGSDDGSSASDAGDDGVYLNQNLPTQTKVETPDTVKVSGSLSKTLGRLEPPPPDGGGGDPGGGDPCSLDTGGQPSGYTQLRGEICNMEFEAKNADLNIILVDSIVKDVQADCGIQAATAAGCDQPENKYSVTFTQSMVNKMKSLMGASADDPDFAAFIPKVGEKMPVPALNYLEDNEAGADYNYIVTLKMPFGGGSIAIKWNTSKTKIAVNNLIVFGTESNTINYSYDDDIKQMKFSMNFFGFDINSTLNQCKTDQPSLKCIEIILKASSTDGFKEEFVGQADNNGGFVQMYYDISTDPLFEPTYYQDVFDGAGNTTSSRFSTDGVSWSCIEGDCNNLGEYYTAVFDESGNSNLDFGNIEAQLSGLTGLTDGDFFVIVPNGMSFQMDSGGTGYIIPFEMQIGSGTVFDGTADLLFFGTQAQLDAMPEVYKWAGFNNTTFEDYFTLVSGINVQAPLP